MAVTIFPDGSRGIRTGPGKRRQAEGGASSPGGGRHRAASRTPEVVALPTIERSVASIHYVGDLDHAGLDIACGARRCAKELGQPLVVPATELHRQMLAAPESFGHPLGWPAQERFGDADRDRILDAVDPTMRGRVEEILRGGRRIPEEVLGPEELREAWE